ncbi:M48 family metallopeptidase [Skermanella sp. TT6]|uniref:M48 family metallopeptidase n=1 Tax=Skermanella cutis TaxID=2775420 RepID=A0ABX7B4L6_9PROT|nr:M48 family metallopeptidase [Skermanella sp. TT6]QQP89309.1 M48 family metallopeptidase [Skermanella sp. TT6]
MCSCSPPLNRRRMLGLLAGVAAAPLVAGCDEIGGFPIRLVSDETVRQLGVESWQRIRAQTPVSQARDLQQALQAVGRRLLQAAGEDPARWEMVVFARDEPNAFALPGGKIGVFEGMFRVAANEHQLAAVIGHEIGHNQAEHSQERLSVAAAKQLGLRLVSAALQIGDVAYANEIAALLGVGVEFGLELPYSRRQELEADELGLLTMARARFDPREAVELWRRMERVGGRTAPAFISTHPAPRARIEALEQILPQVLRNS